MKISRHTAMGVMAATAVLVNIHPAVAQPSFNCQADLNTTEQAICDNTGLAGLDASMSRVYFSELAQKTGDKEVRFKAQQKIWLRWRNSCDADVTCLDRRYFNRINELNGSPAGAAPQQPQAPSPATGAVTRRAVGGEWLERQDSDGTVHRYRPSDGTLQTTRPDGTSSIAIYSNAQTPTIPALPDGIAAWGESLETSLVSIIENILSEPEMQRYQNLTTGKDYYERVNIHVQSVRFFIQP